MYVTSMAEKVVLSDEEVNIDNLSLLIFIFILLCQNTAKDGAHSVIIIFFSNVPTYTIHIHFVEKVVKIFTFVDPDTFNFFL